MHSDHGNYHFNLENTYMILRVWSLRVSFRQCVSDNLDHGLASRLVDCQTNHIHRLEKISEF